MKRSGILASLLVTIAAACKPVSHPTSESDVSGGFFNQDLAWFENNPIKYYIATANDAKKFIVQEMQGKKLEFSQIKLQVFKTSKDVFFGAFDHSEIHIIAEAAAGTTIGILRLYSGGSAYNKFAGAYKVLPRRAVLRPFGSPVILSEQNLMLAIEAAYIDGIYAKDFVCHTQTLRILNALNKLPLADLVIDQVLGAQVAFIRYGLGPGIFSRMRDLYRNIRWRLPKEATAK